MKRQSKDRSEKKIDKLERYMVSSMPEITFPHAPSPTMTSFLRISAICEGMSRVVRRDKAIVG